MPLDLTRLRDGDGVYVIAEIGNNHEGSEEVAHRLIAAAADTGVDAVKLQTLRAEALQSPRDAARFARLRSFELSEDAFRRLADLARRSRVDFISTPYDLASARFLGTFADALKIASGDNDFYPLIEECARTTLPLVMSTGTADLTQAGHAVAAVKRYRGADLRLALLHCVSAYPLPDAEANLRAIGTLATAFPETVPGYSDHTLGIDACVAAVALGARVIEKHFTLDHHYSDFRDHALSAEPAEMSELVSRARRIATMLGTGEKRIQPSEIANLDAIHRSIAPARDLPAGHVLAESDLIWVRPRAAFRPEDTARVVGTRLTRPVQAGIPFETGDVE